MNSINPLARALGSVLDTGRELLVRRGIGGGANVPLDIMCRELLNHRGEASGLALANAVSEHMRSLDDAAILEFLQLLAADFDVDRDTILAAAERYAQTPDNEHLAHIVKAVEAPRQKLFRRINMAPGGTGTLVWLRSHLLNVLREHPQLKPIDEDLKHLFISWFNKGFLELRRIDWESSASVLEKIIDYEAVHAIDGWNDLRARLDQDRLCYAFFHPAMPDDPLVFVEIALTHDIAPAVAPLLAVNRERLPAAEQTTAVFYSISNCHHGLSGISFGNFLIKQVVEELRKENNAIRTFVTLSPVPGFRRWLLNTQLHSLVDKGLLDETLIDSIKEPLTEVVPVAIKEALLKLCAHYLVEVKSQGLAKDPVARFHLGNGARLHRLNWAADLSAKGKHQSAGIMVNYLYDLDKIEVNHEEYFDQGVISASKSVTRLLG